jgi:hypothetical protein
VTQGCHSDSPLENGQKIRDVHFNERPRAWGPPPGGPGLDPGAPAVCTPAPGCALLAAERAERRPLARGLAVGADRRGALGGELDRAGDPSGLSKRPPNGAETTVKQEGISRKTAKAMPQRT